jgi:hypothetical protein
MVHRNHESGMVSGCWELKREFRSGGDAPIPIGTARAARRLDVQLGYLHGLIRSQI